MCDKIKEPSECSKKELEDFYQLVLEGEQVEISGLRDRIKTAKLLAFHYEGNILVGIAALKHPNETYKKKVFKKAGVPEKSDQYNLEIGWVFTKPKYENRGIASGLVRKIVDIFESQNLFAMTKKGHLSMQRILEKNLFRKIGKPYQGRNGKYCLQLFTRRT